jgi:ribosome biogenesis GTPase A
MSLKDKRVLLVGPPGSGKSSTGNTLSNNRIFTTGNRPSRVTTEIEIKRSQNGLIICDMPGLDSDMNDEVFLESFLKTKNALKEGIPIDALVSVIKFDINVGQGFLRASEQFFKAFGTIGIESLIFLCIQTNDETIYGEN